MGLNQTSQHREADVTEHRSTASRSLFCEASERSAPNDAERGAGIPLEPRPDSASSSIAVDIYDQVYHLRGPDPVYLERLAALVDAKMRAVAQHGTTVDSLRVAVLAALNIADELVTLRRQRETLSGDIERTIQSRTETLAEMLDAALESTRKAG